MNTNPEIQDALMAQAPDAIHPGRSNLLQKAAHRGLVWPVLLVVVALIVAPHLSIALQLKGVLWLSFGIVALSLDFLWGRAGIFSFGQNALFGVGAYAYAIFSLNVFPVSHETGSAFVVAALASAVFSGMLGYVLFYGKIGDVYLAIVTLAITLVLYSVISSTSGPQYHIGEALLGGFNGIPSLPSIALGWPGNESTSELSPSAMFGFAACVAGLMYSVVRFLVTGRFGRMLAGLRENELRMDLLGYDTRRLKLIAFVIGGALAGIGGALFAAWGTFVNPAIFSLPQAALIVIWVMVGGRGSLGGAFLGVVLVQWISDEAENVISEQTPLILGVLLVVTVMLAPSGVASLLRRPMDYLLRFISRPPRPETAADLFDGEADTLPDVHESGVRSSGVMRANAIAKNFGGVSVLRGISVDFVGPGIHVVIGANGAGKSTFFGVLTGRHQATDGQVVLNDIDITRAPTFKRARHGLGIKTQVPSLFPGLSVQENLRLAHYEPGRSRSTRLVRRTLQAVGLHRKMNTLVAELAHGEQQWLEIAMVLAQDPAVILLDEPAAGMTAQERSNTVALIQQLAIDHTVIVVEHDMSFIRALSAPISMLHQGKIFRQGTFEEITSDPIVIDAYLGRNHAAHH
ncbi:ATP-binding cassette domain-containing protein [Caballeronia sp. LjRoot34]|uniref:ABC transporter permease subunit n=1 Tax=Caballeronia sp. LjRoot34 TaxID=3342325 RepID=UPI003ECD4AC8